MKALWGGFGSAILLALTTACGTATGDEAATQEDAARPATVAGALCSPIPACDAALPDVGASQPWRHARSPIIANATPNHRGRDTFVNPGASAWAIAKFAYGIIDKDLTDEDVTIYLDSGCTGKWQSVGATTTTSDSDPPRDDGGVVDDGGRAYFSIPADKLRVGRNRVLFVVAGDLTTTESIIEVIPKGAPMFVSDVDGTLTSSENVEFMKLIEGELPETHEGAPDALWALVKKGYHPMYLTARPEWLVGRTREFLAVRGFPPGIIHTTTTETGNIGGGAADFKTAELAALASSVGLVPSFGFGNTVTDAQAYENAGIKPVEHRFFYQFADDTFGGRNVASYTDLLPAFAGLKSLCR